MSPSSRYQKSAKPPFSCRAYRGSSVPMSFFQASELKPVNGPSTSPCSAPRSSRCFQPATAACDRRRELAEFHSAPPLKKTVVSSTLIRASGSSSVPDVHSSEMRWKMARASVPPWEPTPSCRIAAVRVAIAPSLSANHRLETYFHRNSSIWISRTFLGLLHLGPCVVQSSGMSAVACLHFRKRSNPLIVVEYFCHGVFFFLQKKNRELRIESESTFF